VLAIQQSGQLPRLSPGTNRRRTQNFTCYCCGHSTRHLVRDVTHCLTASPTKLGDGRRKMLPVTTTDKTAAIAGQNIVWQQLSSDLFSLLVLDLNCGIARNLQGAGWALCRTLLHLAPQSAPPSPTVKVESGLVGWCGW